MTRTWTQTQSLAARRALPQAWRRPSAATWMTLRPNGALARSRSGAGCSSETLCRGPCIAIWCLFTPKSVFDNLIAFVRPNLERLLMRIAAMSFCRASFPPLAVALFPFVFTNYSHPGVPREDLSHSCVLARISLAYDVFSRCFYLLIHPL